MADTKSGTLATILENLRDAAVRFGTRFSVPAQLHDELIALLADLGIAKPETDVLKAMEDAAATWADITDPLKDLKFNVLDPIAAARGLAEQAGIISDKLEALGALPASTLAALGDRAGAIQAALPERLVGYLMYEFITQAHPKIGGAFMLLGVLRRPFTLANGNPAFVSAPVRVFDMQQLVKVLTNPREALLDALKWGSDDFDAQTVIDGLSLLIGIVDQTRTVLGPDHETFSTADEANFVGRSAAELQALQVPSPRRTLQLPLSNILSLVGLHRDGLGLLALAPVHFTGSIGGLHLPDLGNGRVLALSAGTPPATADPRVRLLP